MLRAAWDAHDPAADEAAGAEAALGLGMLFGISGSFTESTMWLDRALGSATGSEPWYDAARCMRAVPFTLSGEGDRALSLFRDMPERRRWCRLPGPTLLPTAAWSSSGAGDLQGAAEDLGLAVRRIRAGLQVRFPGQPLAFLAEAEFRRGRWDDCQDHAELAVSLARDADRDYDLPRAQRGCRGYPPAAATGRLPTATSRRRRRRRAPSAASPRSSPPPLAASWDSPGMTRMRCCWARPLALAVPEIDCYDDPAAFWWRPLQIWALVRTGQLGEAEAILAAFESRAAGRGERWR